MIDSSVLVQEVVVWEEVNTLALHCGHYCANSGCKIYHLFLFLHNVGSGNMSVFPINSGSYVTVFRFTIMPLVTACVV